jgi:hypothetical protein
MPTATPALSVPSRVLVALSFLLFLQFTTATSVCPCLSTHNGALDSYKVDGQLYRDDIAYPNDYGRGLCYSQLLYAVHHVLAYLVVVLRIIYFN